jgi:hypothetical protein
MKRRTFVKLAIVSGALLFFAGLWWKWIVAQLKPIALSGIQDQRQLIEAIAETIWPATDTPGAKEAGVADYIIMMIRDCTSENEQQTFMRGLRRLENYSMKKYGKSFSECDGGDQIQIVRYIEGKDIFTVNLLNKVRRRLYGESFFAKMKWLTVEGYCTSLLGATKGLRYDDIPMRYEGCILLKEGDAAWATN